jgi:hypothetical protein
MGCGNTHTPATVQLAAATACEPSHPQLPARETPLLLPAPRRGAYLAHGRARHTTLQHEYAAFAKEAGLKDRQEVSVTKPDGRRGFVDHLIYMDQAHREATIIEFKTDRFDNLSPSQLETRIDKHLEQIDSYRFSETLNLETSMSWLHIDQRPTTPGTRNISNSDAQTRALG